MKIMQSAFLENFKIAIPKNSDDKYVKHFEINAMNKNKIELYWSS